MNTPTRSTAQAAKASQASMFVFVGDPNDNFSGPPAITVKGVRFVRNRSTEVPPELVKVFEGHNHFQTPEKAEKTMKKLAAASAAASAALDEDDEDDHGGKTAPRRASKGSEGGEGNYANMSMAQLHMAVAEKGKSAEGNATKEELIALLKAE